MHKLLSDGLGDERRSLRLVVKSQRPWERSSSTREHRAPLPASQRLAPSLVIHLLSRMEVREPCGGHRSEAGGLSSAGTVFKSK